MPNIRQIRKWERKTKKWTQEAMDQAKQEVEAGRLSLRQAAMRFGVPKSSLSDRVSGRVASDFSICWRSLLTHADEDSLVEYCLYSALHGFPLLAEINYNKSTGKVRRNVTKARILTAQEMSDTIEEVEDRAARQEAQALARRDREQQRARDTSPAATSSTLPSGSRPSHRKLGPSGLRQQPAPAFPSPVPQHPLPPLVPPTIPSCLPPAADHPGRACLQRDTTILHLLSLPHRAQDWAAKGPLLPLPPTQKEPAPPPPCLLGPRHPPSHRCKEETGADSLAVWPVQGTRTSRGSRRIGVVVSHHLCQLGGG
ncbi:hypothetical protein PFLUV_G00278470 [Perca fluviatilis]|uniref:HTH psq-type domain-containing protein n=1 Tax=Perca fluviatilis TaxID=8168 RepID=A0A6A5E5X9_PERFL|nr:hypothetical protein PFLUV_G00278470 [Perca fluviatilis]